MSRSAGGKRRDGNDLGEHLAVGKIVEVGNFAISLDLLSEVKNVTADVVQSAARWRGYVDFESV
jgi:hypothetical protein